MSSSIVTSLNLGLGTGFLLAAGGALRLLVLLVGVDRFWLDVATVGFLLAAAVAAGGAFRFLLLVAVPSIGVYGNGEN
jgi:hypothetical protein